ncbi:MAG TPA: ATP-grasp domain-containing protein [Acidimicrobiia bacterium]|nr:ATP-grasp domain-containing protein [Acidimicrobiia bacterium]
MTVLFLSPGFPVEMNDFVRALAEAGATVIGMGDQPQASLPAKAEAVLAAYVQVDFDDVDGCVDAAAQIAQRVGIDRVESLWEPLMMLAARIRLRLGLPGLTVDQTIPFRDKEHMKARLDAAGIRTPHHYRARSGAEVREAIERIGFPAIIKPIAGAGSDLTFRVDDVEELSTVIDAVGSVAEVSVEEFVDGQEFTFDTICADGEIRFYNICWYRPRPLIGKQNEWISQQTVALKDPDVDYLASGRRMGSQVIEALGFRDGFTHMEWYLTAEGEAVFGEIGARPPGGRTVDAMNWTADIDLFRWWADAVLTGSVPGNLDRTYNAITIFKRAVGSGSIRGYVGLDHLMAEYGEWVVALDLNPVGSQRRDWRAALLGDGMIALRHPDLETAIHMADRFASELTVLAQ